MNMTLNTDNRINSNVITDPNTPIGDTGWTYGQAVEELIETGAHVDLELFPFAKTMVGIATVGITTGATGDSDALADAEAFERATGWSWGDALDEAAEIQRHRRLFGSSH